MQLRVPVFLGILFFASSALAVDPGRAQGTVTIDNTRVDLNYAYAIGRQTNDITHRKDDRRVFLTDKPLPDGFKLEDNLDSLPDNAVGLIVCLSHTDKVTHVLLQHAKGMYDASYFEDDPSYTFKPLKTDRGVVAGNLSSKKVKTNTLSFSFDVDFNAAIK
jgi:hypothetical protein